MMKLKFVLSAFAVLSLSCVLTACNGSPQDVIGTYSSLNNGSVQITAFDGDEGDFLAQNITLPRLNNGNTYTTPSNETEVFTVARVVGDNYRIRFSIDGVAYIGDFDLQFMSITVEGTTYAIV